MITLKPQQEFIIFCLELFKTEKKIAGNSALNIFRQKKVLDYLDSGYEVLHTQGANYILADILDYLKHHK